MENEKELTREELKGCISSYKKAIELQKEEIESLKKENEFLSKKPEFDYRYKYENYKDYAGRLESENKQLKKNFRKMENDYDNLLDKCKKFESANEGLHKEISDHKLDGRIIESLQDDKKQLKAGIEKLQQNYDDLYDYVKGVERENKDLKELNESLYDNLKETEYKLKLIKREYNSSDINILQIEKKELLELLDKSKKEIEKLEQEIEFLNKKFNESFNANNNIIQHCQKVETENSLLKSEIADLDKKVIFLQDDNLRLEQENTEIRKSWRELNKYNLNLHKEADIFRERITKLESDYNELKNQYDMGLICSIKDGVVMTKKYDDLNEKEKNYKRCLNRVFENNGFLVQLFSDYFNLQYCYDNFIKHGFDVQQVGSDTLIIRNK